MIKRKSKYEDPRARLAWVTPTVPFKDRTWEHLMNSIRMAESRLSGLIREKLRRDRWLDVDEQ